MTLAIIGDVHGKIDQYNEIANCYESSVQIGDMGFDYSGINVDPKKHRWFPGNHDNYDLIESRKVPSVFPFRFGFYELGGVEFFFVSGAFSVDMLRRERQGKDKTWWWQEELSPMQMNHCFSSYIQHMPEIVLSHDAPQSIVRQISSARHLRWMGWESDMVTRTSNFLEWLLYHHRPKLWIFGHHHKSWQTTIEGTEFRCLNELEVFEIQGGTNEKEQD